jgi:hypothetical protein
MGYFDPKTGRMVSGQMMNGGRSATGSEIAVAVTEAVARCQHKKYGSARKELERLFKTYPQLRSDSWPVGAHPVSPLIELFAREVLG